MMKTGQNMTDRFLSANFSYYGGYLTYNGKFVARFKYGKKDKPGFVKFLKNNFSVTEYSDRLSAGETPVKILESKGYISKTIVDIITQYGFEPTQAGFEKYVTMTRHQPEKKVA
jgi:hypothetical protein